MKRLRTGTLPTYRIISLAALPLLLAALVVMMHGVEHDRDTARRLDAYLDAVSMTIDSQLRLQFQAAEVLAQQPDVAATFAQDSPLPAGEGLASPGYAPLATLLHARDVILLSPDGLPQSLSLNPSDLPPMPPSTEHQQALIDAMKLASGLRETVVTDYIEPERELMVVSPVLDNGRVIGFVGMSAGTERLVSAAASRFPHFLVIEQQSIDTQTRIRLFDNRGMGVSSGITLPASRDHQAVRVRAGDFSEWFLASRVLQGTRLTVTALAPADELDAPMRQFSRLAMGAGLFLSIVFALLGRPFTSRYAREEQAAEAIMAGKPQVPDQPLRQISPPTQVHASMPGDTDYGRIVARMTDAFIRTDDQHRIIDVNQACINMFGYESREQLLGHDTALLYASNDEKELMRRWLGDGRRVTNVLLQASRRNGSTFWVEINADEDSESEPPCFNVFLRDVSDHIELERSLSNARSDAEHAALIRTEFLARMSHEMRTPMNAIIGLSHLALRADINAQQRDYLTKINEAGTGLLGIINDVLDLARIEAGKIELSESEVYIEGLLRKVVNLVGAQLRSKGIEMVIRLSDAVPRLLVTDPLRLHQVLLNLVSNAVKFTDEGEIIIDIHCESGLGTELRLFVSVTDSGIGVSDEQAETLFDQFRQGDASIKQRYGGSGLGLSISKSIVEAMGGNIAVSGTPGVGSVFSFSVIARRSQSSSSESAPAPDDIPQHVLIVDDNTTARQALFGVLQRWVQVVDECASGGQAIDLIRDPSQQYDCIFIDLNLTDIPAKEVVRILAGASSPNPPRVVVMAGLDKRTLQASSDGPAFSYDISIEKPLLPSDVLETLQSLSQKGADPAEQDTRQEAEPCFDLSGVRALLVEDNEINQQLAQELLSSAGVQVTLADNGQRALDLLNDGLIVDLVLMDIQMPVLDGIEATLAIRADKRWRQLPVVALTANAMQSDLESYLRCGMQDCVTKPIDPDVLFATIDRWRHGTDRSSSDAAPEENTKDNERLEADDDLAAVASAAVPTAARRSAPVAAPGKDTPFPAMHGINVTLALTRVAGRQDIYARLLSRVTQNYIHSAEVIRQLLANGEQENAKREAHSIKGVAGNIGADALFEAALALENSIRQAQDIDDSLGRFEAVLQETLAVLSDGLARYESLHSTQSQPSAPVVSIAPSDVAAILSRLAHLLDEDDMETTRFAHQQANDLRAALGDQDVDELLAKIDAFDFQSARATVQRIATQRGFRLDSP